MTAHVEHITEARGGIKIGRSGSNPGYLSIELPTRAAFDAAAKVFPEMAGQDWLVGSTDSLGFLSQKEGDEYWVAWVWWEDRREGLELFIRNHYSYSSTGESPASAGLNIEVRPNAIRSPLKPERHSYGKIPGRLAPKTYVMRSVQHYLRGVQAGTNGTDRVFARRARGPVKAGGKAQRAAVERVKALAAAAGREVEEKPPTAGEVTLTVMPDYSRAYGVTQTPLLIWVSKLGKVRVSTLGSTTRDYKGRAAWDAIEQELRESLTEAQRVTTANIEAAGWGLYSDVEYEEGLGWRAGTNLSPFTGGSRDKWRREQEEETRKIQARLDQTFGRGMLTADCTDEWVHIDYAKGRRP